MPLQLDTIGLVVQNMPRALAFYRTLGLDLNPSLDHEPHVEYTAPSGYSIGFVTEAMVRQTDPQWSGNSGDRVNLQFRLDQPTQVDETFQRLTAAGYRSYQAPWDAFWGQRFARVIDPDGNVINLFSPLPGDQAHP